MEERTRQSRPTTAADLHRLAALAHERGLRLTQAQPGVWFCSSASTPDVPHYVTGLSCDCRGFAEQQRCSHLALLLDALGWLPAVVDVPTPSSPALPCTRCNDLGKVEEFGRGWNVIDVQPCPACALPVAA